MPLPSISFLEGKGGLGRALDSKDHISGLVFYTATLPSGFASTSVATRCKIFYGTDDAIAAGILNDYSDGIGAQATYLFTAIGANGDTIELKVLELNPLTGNTRTTSLGVFTKTAAESTVALLAAAYAALINAGTPSHGYSATVATATVTITAPKKQGAFLNTGTPLSAAIVGTIAGTIAQFGAGALVDGVSSSLAIYYYHISEFFRMQPKGFLYVGFFAVPGSYTFSEVSDLQNIANGDMRQVGVYKDAVWASADLQALHTVCNTNKLLFQGLSGLYAANLQATTDITTIVDVSTLNSQLASNIIGQDAGGVGNFLYRQWLKSISNLGAVLGAVALRRVHESIAWPEETNLSNGTECEVIGFSNGQLVSALSRNALEALNTKRHIFMLKITGMAGSFINEPHTCTATTSDYANIQENRTMVKIQRLLYASYAPKLSSPIQFNSNGTLADNTVALFENIGNSALDVMLKPDPLTGGIGEISDRLVTVNPAQNVVSSNSLIIGVVVVINGVAKNIVIPINFKPSIAA